MRAREWGGAPVGGGGPAQHHGISASHLAPGGLLPEVAQVLQVDGQPPLAAQLQGLVEAVEENAPRMELRVEPERHFDAGGRPLPLQRTAPLHQGGAGGKVGGRSWPRTQIVALRTQTSFRIELLGT